MSINNINNDDKLININQELNESLEFKKINPFSDGILTKSFYSSSNKNLINTLYDNQGVEYTEGYTREKFLTFRKRKHKAFRCCKENVLEKVTRKNYFEKIQNDIFYTFDKFTNMLPIHITHFQVRKNFLLFRSNEIAYTTEYGIQSFNLLNNLKSDLCIYPPQDSNEAQDLYVICFDICETAEKDYLICYGKSNGTIRILKIRHDELKNIRTNFSKVKNNIFMNNKGSTKSDFLCDEVITVGSGIDDIFTNYVKFIDKGKYILTTSNDSYIRIYSLQDKLVLLKKFKSNYPVNHCDANFDLNNFNEVYQNSGNFDANSGNNVIGAIGDSNFIELFDFHNEKIITQFKGHYDNCTVLRFLKGDKNWNFVTGNQDLTCKIWDLRKLKSLVFDKDEIVEPQKLLCANIDSVGDIAVINRDSFVFCENFDFFNIYNMKYDTVQSVNYIGHFAGIVYHKQYDKIHIALKEENLNGILTFAGIKNYTNNLNNLNIF